MSTRILLLTCSGGQSHFSKSSNEYERSVPKVSDCGADGTNDFASKTEIKSEINTKKQFVTHRGLLDVL